MELLELSHRQALDQLTVALVIDQIVPSHRVVHGGDLQAGLAYRAVEPPPSPLLAGEAELEVEAGGQTALDAAQQLLVEAHVEPERQVGLGSFESQAEVRNARLFDPDSNR